MCGCCVSECNSMEADPDFLGPAALAKALPLRRRRARPRQPRTAARPQRRARHLGLHPLLLLQPALPEGRRPARRDRQARRRDLRGGHHARRGRQARHACSSRPRTAAATCARPSSCPRRSGRSPRCSRCRSRSSWPAPARCRTRSRRTRRRTTTRCSRLWKLLELQRRKHAAARARRACQRRPRERTDAVQDRYAYYPGCLASLSQKELDSLDAGRSREARASSSSTCRPPRAAAPATSTRRSRTTTCTCRRASSARPSARAADGC